nr:MAG TPA: hypothetical protein [Caudoviricetes sp.]
MLLLAFAEAESGTGFLYLLPEKTAGRVLTIEV